MLGLGLSITSPLRILTVPEGGGPPEPAGAFIQFDIGSPGPSTNFAESPVLTETFYTKTVDLGGGKHRIHTYELFIPNLENIAGLPLASFAPRLLGEYFTAANTLDGIVYTDPDMETVSNFSIVSDDEPILDGDEGQTVFKEFMRYLYTTQETPTGQNYLGRDFLFGSTNGISTTNCFNGYTGEGEDLVVKFHLNAFNEVYLNSIVAVAYPEFDSYIDFLNSNEYPGSGIFSFQGEGPVLTQALGIMFRVNTVTVTETDSQPALVQLPPFGVAPTAPSLLSGTPELVAGAIGFTSETELILGGVPNTVNGVYQLNFTMEESYFEVNGVAVSGTDLYPLGMHDDGTTPITTFHTNLSLGYADTNNITTVIAATIVFTNAGSSTTIIGSNKIKNFVYTGAMQIQEEDFPALYASTENGAIVYPASILEISNMVPESNTYTVSDTVVTPYEDTLNLPLIGVTVNDLLEWLIGATGDPGTSLSLLPATDPTYNATPPATNPTITQYSSTLPLKGAHVDFSAGVADLATAYATSGTDFTFIAIGINKNVANSTEQFIVNRKTTTEGLGIKSDATYIKLKNASIPTNTTPGGSPAQDYQDFTPFFLYLEKNSTVISEYNEFNEEVKRYSAGANDILELDRITDNFTGSLSYIAVKDNTLSNTQRAKFIESLRTKYLDLNVINRHG